MTIPSGVLELWQQYSSTPFPKGYGGKVINGINLSLLDAEIAGCVHMYVHNSGELDSRHMEIISKCLVDLNTVLLLLNQEELIYFKRLAQLADLVLQEVKR